MLEHLFGSRTRLKLLHIFLTNAGKEYYVRELTRVADEHINSIRRELSHLEKLGLIKGVQQDKKKFYTLDSSCIIFPELKALIYKDKFTTEQHLVQQIQSLGKIHYLALAGMFVGEQDAKTDIFIVGRVNRDKLKELLDDMQPGFDRQVFYTILSAEEFQYRKEIADKFVTDFSQAKKIVLVDDIKL